MAEPYCGVVVNLYIFGRYVSISTPNWTHDVPHKPSWLPKWEFITWEGAPCQSKMFMLDWFFHLCIMYGGPTKLRDPQPSSPDDDDDDDFDDNCDDDTTRNLLLTGCPTTTTKAGSPTPNAVGDRFEVLRWRSGLDLILLLLMNFSNKMVKLNEANEILCDEKKRKKYDETRENIKGKVFGNYRILDVIAEGGFGKTYKAETIINQLPVCIKHAFHVSA